MSLIETLRTFFQVFSQERKNYNSSIGLYRLYTNAAFVFDLLKTKAQNNKENRMSYRHEIRRIMNSEGLFGFTRGYTAMYLRDAPGFALYFCLFDIMKRKLGVPTNEDPK
jgi:hypothetical protein